MKFLMLCHDQAVDRRILQQARALQEMKWDGTILCLSQNGEDCFDEDSGVKLFRLGLNKIVPPCPIYAKYIRRQQEIRQRYYTRPHQWFSSRRLKFTGVINALFSLRSHINWRWYQISLLLYYHNRRLHCPMPFDECFYHAGLPLGPADAVWAHDLPALPAAHRLAKQWGAKLIYDAHELYYEQKVFSRKQKSMMREAEANLIHECDLTFTVNDSIADELARRYHCRRPNVLLNVTDAPPKSDLSTKPDHLRRHFELNGQTKILLFQGGLLPFRNLENLAAAMFHVRHPGAVLVFMGNGTLRDRLLHIVLRRGLRHRVLFKNMVSQEELIAWSASADVGVIPYPAVDLNTRFCTPNKLFEYIQAGVPILANDLPELNRYVRDTGFGRTVDMRNPRVIAAGIDSFLADESALSAARECLLRRRKKFSWEAYRDFYVEQIHSLFEEKTAQ